MKAKKIISIIVSLIIIFGMFSVSAAAESENTDYDYVARMYICTRTKGIGHVWLYFENLTEDTIRVGAYDLPSGQGVTVSVYNIARKDGNGNYYNIDGYCLNKYGWSGTTCASMELTAEQLVIVSNKIVSRNKWSGTKNCCEYAGSVWNSVAPKKMKILLTPLLMGTQIKKVKCTTPNFYNPQEEQCFKQVGTGDGATLRQCSSGSYNRYVG